MKAVEEARKKMNLLSKKTEKKAELLALSSDTSNIHQYALIRNSDGECDIEFV